MVAERVESSAVYLVEKLVVSMDGDEAGMMVLRLVVAKENYTAGDWEDYEGNSTGSR